MIKIFASRNYDIIDIRFIGKLQVYHIDTRPALFNNKRTGFEVKHCSA